MDKYFDYERLVEELAKAHRDGYDRLSEDVRSIQSDIKSIFSAIRTQSEQLAVMASMQVRNEQTAERVSMFNQRVSNLEGSRTKDRTTAIVAAILAVGGAIASGFKSIWGSP